MQKTQLFTCFLISFSCLSTSLAWGEDPPPEAVSEIDPEIPAVAPINQDRVDPGTGGGPGSATTFIVQYIYLTGFAEQIHLYGLAAAASLILAIGLMTLTLAQLRLSKASEAGKLKK
jgi:hypothetical protein